MKKALISLYLLVNRLHCYQVYGKLALCVLIVISTFLVIASSLPLHPHLLVHNPGTLNDPIGGGH